MTQEHKKGWKCPACYCKLPKNGNLNTPVRPLNQNEIDRRPQSPETANVTFRKHTSAQINVSLCSEDISSLGDTIFTETKETNTPTELTLQMLSDTIAKKLQENNIKIITELQNAIKNEVQQSVKILMEELKQDIHLLKEENNCNKLEIQKLHMKLENQQKEIDRLKTFNENINTVGHQNAEINRKKIVLYGLKEYYKEPEHNLLERIHEIFQEILNVDLNGYIEDTHRIGRYNNNGNRPLVIELIRKRMAKYLIENSNCFNGIVFSVSEFLDRATQLKRKALREEMHIARKNGLHAILKNNQLFIEGKRVNMSEVAQSFNMKNQPNSKDYERKTQSPEENNTSRNNDNSFRKN
ncbi:unnamed protein product [Chilo suppressalis]|uniref:DUF4806 domain-containing protein n=1 Tax=Chilo suppressalis TaxID=168631 RepID=A0ABN8AZL3_CHISP|nr:unnamed protein product [Chilo suppressalis]